MADFKIAYEKMIATQGANPHSSENELDKTIVLCSNCFKDEGLKLDAFAIGIEDGSKCPNCKATEGHKLSKGLVEKLCYRFFVRGTMQRVSYGASPLIQFNKQHFTKTEINVSPWLVNDVKIIENAIGIGLFYYGPRFWMIGEIEPLKSLQTETERAGIIRQVLEKYPTYYLTEKYPFYRLRLNPENPGNPLEYDSPPDKFLGKNRFDDINFPVLYGSPDMELCLHECRTSVEDEIYMAKLVPVKRLKVLDLSSLIEEENTEFESLDMTIHFLFLAGEHSYEICRAIAQEVKKQGFDGMIYPSYFSYIRLGLFPFETIYGMSIRRLPPLKQYAQYQSVPNLVLFGRPISENKIIVECVNKVVINRIKYDVSFGPVNDQKLDAEEYKKDYTEKTMKKWEEIFKQKNSPQS